MSQITLSAASMCRSIFRLAFLTVLVFTIQPIGQANAVSDSDWNISFKDDGCVMPSINSTKWLTEDGNRFIRFTLNDKDKGNCPTDRVSRDGAFYWERAELKSERLYFNKKYELTFEARFVEGFLGYNETFFQIHAHNTPCWARPPAMLKISTQRIELHVLKQNATKRGGFAEHKTQLWIEDLIGDWKKFKFVFDTSKKPKISMYIDENIIFDDLSYWIQPCGIPHFKFGIYRPGNEPSPIPRSVVDFDKFQLKVLDEDFRQK
jgi:hypothetical protein